MTTESDFHAALDADPAAGMTRWVFAEWLEENARDLPCAAVGRYHADLCDGGRVQAPNSQFTVECLHCRGTGTVSDGRRERAAGYRAMAELGHYPERYDWGVGRRVEWSWYSREGYQHIGSQYLPDDWLATLWADARDQARDSYHRHWVEYDTRREAEDVAALAFGRLPPDVQARILAGVTA